MARAELQSTAALKATMAAHFESLRQAVGERHAPIAWCTSVGPVEILRALGFRVFFPENHGAMLGAARKANDTMPRAHALGYSPDICSYLTSDIGAYLSRETPLAAFGFATVPRADVLVFNTNQCRDVRDWFEFYGREWNVPVLGVRSPRSLERVTDGDVDAVAWQLEAMVEPLEGIAGRRLDAGALETRVRLSRECSDLWKACLESATHRPAPITFFDAAIHMGPAVVLRGAPEAPAYYRVLLAELEARVQAGIGAVEGERFRLYWEGMPIWGKLRMFSTLFAELAASVVVSTYCNSWIFDALDPADPIRSMARASLELFIVGSEEPKERYIREHVTRYGVDGILFHDCRTCPNNSNARYGMPRRVASALGVPALVLDGDVNDLRCFSEEQSKTSIEGFIEQLADFRPAAHGARGR
jgi:benzoyl-CoA reductase/2-hydroxyglutaryl-CoA dehydratase subunit BcrC/BadD/HgdB